MEIAYQALIRIKGSQRSSVRGSNVRATSCTGREKKTWGRVGKSLVMSQVAMGVAAN